MLPITDKVSLDKLPFTYPILISQVASFGFNKPAPSALLTFQTAIEAFPEAFKVSLETFPSWKLEKGIFEKLLTLFKLKSATLI